MIGANYYKGSCTGCGACIGPVIERARFGRARPIGYGSASVGHLQASIEHETSNIKTLRAEENMEVRRADPAIVLEGPKLLQLNRDFPPGLRFRQEIRFFLSLA